MNSYWLKSARYDLVFLVLSPLFGFLWLPAYFLLQSEAPLKLAAIQFLITATPHAILTLYILWHLDTTKKLKSSFAWPALFLSVSVTAFAYWYKLTWISNLVISAVFLFGTWHVLKQHIGVSRLYDYVLSERRFDKKLMSQMRPVYWFYQLAIVTIYVFALSSYQFTYSTEIPWSMQLIYPKASQKVLGLLYFLTGASFLYAAYHILYLRIYKMKSFIPWPQFLVLGTSLLQPLVLITLPQAAWFLLWLAPPLGHHIQYFGYVWLFLQKTDEVHKDRPTLVQFITSKKLLPLYFIFLLCSMSIHFFSVFGWIFISALILQFLTMFHYITDGIVWKKESNLLLNTMSRRLRSS